MLSMYVDKKKQIKHRKEKWRIRKKPKLSALDTLGGYGTGAEADRCSESAPAGRETGARTGNP